MQKRLLYLDGLRGLAAVVVYCHHFATTFFPASVYGAESIVRTDWERVVYATPLGVFINGNFAVHLFLAVSAYVMVRSVSAAAPKWSFAVLVGRYVRLMVPIAAATLLGYGLMQLSDGIHLTAASVTHSPWFAELWPPGGSFWHALWEGTVGTLWRRNATYNASVWMMFYIWYGSLAIYAVSAFVRKPRTRVALYVVGLTLSLVSVFAAFWLGALLAHFSDAISARAQRLANARATSYVLLVLGLLFGGFPSFFASLPTVYRSFDILGVNLFEIVNTTHLVGTALLLTALLTNSKVQRFFSARPLVALGKVSFSLYLIHLLLITSLSSWFFIHFLSLSYVVANAWSFMLTSVALAVCTTAFHHLVTQPAERLSKRIASL